MDRHVSRAAWAQVFRQKYLDELKQQPRYADPRRLARFEHRVFSQGGEDGVVREIFRRIGEGDRTFLEIGVGDGLENNTAFLLMQGWRGVWIDGSAKNAALIRSTCASDIAAGRLTLVESLVAAENVSNLIAAATTSPIDLFSLDVDRNTHHIWAALAALKPRVAVIEYNAVFPADVVWTADYDPAKWWNGTLYFGASLKALELMGAKLGYALVGCDLAGVNAFFVRNDLVGEHFLAPFTSENHYEPVRYYLHGRLGHPPALHD